MIGWWDYPTDGSQGQEPEERRKAKVGIRNFRGNRTEGSGQMAQVREPITDNEWTSKMLKY
jgi:hypothetical protein